MCDFSTWLGDALGGVAEAAGGGAGEAAGLLGGIPSVAEDFGSYLGGLLTPSMEGGGEAIGAFMPEPSQFANVAPQMESLPLPAAAPFGMDSDPSEYFRFNVENPPAGVGTVPLAAQGNDPTAQASLLSKNPLVSAGAGVASSGLAKSGLGFIQDNYKWMLPALGLGYAAMKPNRSVAGEHEISAIAHRAQQMGEQLTDPLLTGQFPAGYQSTFDRMQRSAEAAIKSKYASMGLTGSSMERSELASVPQQLETQKLQIAQSLASQGMQALGLTGQYYGALANSTLAQDKELSNALAQFGAASMRM